MSMRFASFGGMVMVRSLFVMLGCIVMVLAGRVLVRHGHLLGKVAP